MSSMVDTPRDAAPVRRSVIPAITAVGGPRSELSEMTTPDPGLFPRPLRHPALAWVGILAVAAGAAWLGPTMDRLVPLTLLYSAWTALLLLLVFRGGGVLDRPLLLLGGAVLLRVLFLPTVPDLSVDPFRYLWDGWLTASGVNPYRYTPSDPALVHLQGDLLFREMNSRDFFSIYPPLSQWLFAPAGALYERLGWPGAFLALKATMTTVETVGLLLLYRAMSRTGMKVRYLALYAWNPLAVLVVAGVGHSEAGLVLGLGILVLGLAAERITLTWVGLGLAVISKGIPILLAPLLMRHHWRRHGGASTLQAVAVGLIPAAALSAPFLMEGLAGRAWASADLYVSLFEFNAGLYALLAGMLGALPGVDPRTFLGPALRVGFLGAAAWIWIRHPTSQIRDVIRGALLLFGLYLVTATTVHPWYLLWGLCLVPLVRTYRGPWLWAAWAAMPTYFAYVGVSEGALAALFWGGVLLLVLREEWPSIRSPLLRLAGIRKARQIAPHLVGDTVLDLGAGEGLVGRGLARREGRTVILADLVPAFQVSLPGFVFDGRSLPLENRSVDTVVLSLVLHHAREPRQLLGEALRVARHRVIITESTFRWRWERRLLEVVDRQVNRKRGGGTMDREPLHFDTARNWEARAEAAGGRVLLSRRLNRVGHRHHLLVVEPMASAEPRRANPPG